MENKQLAVLWDMDGTILDTLDVHYLTWKEAFGSRAPGFSRELFRKHFGGNNRSTVPIYLGYEPDEETYQQIVTYKEELFRQQFLEKAELFPGIRDWFAYFSKIGAKQAIASSAMLENIEKVVDAFDIRGYFSALVPGEDLPSKPAPDIFLRAAGLLGVPPARCVVFEDSIHGINAARAAGMVSVGVAGTTEFKPGDADFLLGSYTQNPAVLTEAILNLMNTHQSD
ncbi:MAG: HAD family phosphatase [Chloroflexi bacterium]|nr:HAD family phosphatase [Anaerolineaceae bacterium]NLI44662.1 HAD family phosphatase [Chloroflexota bacterium]HOE35304.1 HAD family phosphatase [Anaerolineaceae bacterium]HOT25672.1 HAD family phosphatase [Anaerolineaceae bacterium]HQH57852.1 HAD family phosphatase [Anaerolineaceae bacterium]